MVLEILDGTLMRLGGFAGFECPKLRRLPVLGFFFRE